MQRERRASNRHLHYWWFFAHQAASSLQHHEDHEARAALIALAEQEEVPEEDYEAAICFLTFANWEYEAGNYDGALAFAEKAASIDRTWGESAFFLGWYRLALGGGDPLEAFLEAVRREPDLLFRIASDPECRRHPHILQRLKAATAETLVASGKPRPA